MIDVMSLYQFAHQVQGEQMAVAARARGLAPRLKVKKVKQGKKKTKGGQTDTQPSANPLDFTSTYKDNPMYDADSQPSTWGMPREGGTSQTPSQPSTWGMPRPGMSETSANARAFQEHVESRISAFRNQRR